MSTLAVIAKAPRPGHSKTRLTPPLSPSGAAELAYAALADTLDAVRAARCTRRVLVLDGPADRCPDLRGFELLEQCTGPLERRLADAFAQLGGPALLVGMDTPQLTPALLERGLEQLDSHDAVLARACDGGYWAIGLRRSGAAVFEGITMSLASTGAAQRRRLDELGLRTAELPALRDIDLIADAYEVAALAPQTQFAAELDAQLAELERAA